MPRPAFDALDALAERAGYRAVDPPILQPAELFLDLLGEDLRRRAFITTDADGREFCLRPDFTVSVSRHHLAHAGGTSACYAYRGPVFRARPDAPGESLQAGFERFGRTDSEAADAEMLALALEAAAVLGLASPEILMGDAGLVAAMLDALDLPAVWRRRLASDLKRSKNLDADLARLGEGGAGKGTASYAGFLAALEGADPGAARAAVADLLSIAGIKPMGGRSVDEVADRFLEQAALSSGGGISRDIVALTRRLLAVSGAPDDASGALRSMAAEAGLDMTAALDAFDRRTGFMAAAGLSTKEIRFSTAFGRGLDYYTGFLFELHDATRSPDQPIVGGGRYDQLMTRLGSLVPIPAVGCSIWLERVAGGAA